MQSNVRKKKNYYDIDLLGFESLKKGTNFADFTSEKKQQNSYTGNYTGTNMSLGNQKYAPTKSNPLQKTTQTKTATTKSSSNYISPQEDKDFRDAFNAVFDEDNGHFPITKSLYPALNEKSAEATKSPIAITNQKSKYSGLKSLNDEFLEGLFWDDEEKPASNPVLRPKYDWNPEKQEKNYLTEDFHYYDNKYGQWKPTDADIIGPSYNDDTIFENAVHVTEDQFYDGLSNTLSVAGMLPVVGTAFDILAGGVDAARGDYTSAALSFAGALPFGQTSTATKLGINVADGVSDATKIVDVASDTAKVLEDIRDTAKAIDVASDTTKVIDVAKDVEKTTDAVSDFSNFPKSIHSGKQGKHIVGHNNYIPGRSVVSITQEELQELVVKHSGTGVKYGTKEVVDFGVDIGMYIDIDTGQAFKTTFGTIHYSNRGVHVVPAPPKEWR